MKKNLQLTAGENTILYNAIKLSLLKLAITFKT